MVNEHWKEAKASKTRIWIDEKELKWKNKTYSPSKDYGTRSPVLSPSSSFRSENGVNNSGISLAAVGSTIKTGSRGGGVTRKGSAVRNLAGAFKSAKPQEDSTEESSSDEVSKKSKRGSKFGRWSRKRASHKSTSRSQKTVIPSTPGTSQQRAATKKLYEIDSSSALTSPEESQEDSDSDVQVIPSHSSKVGHKKGHPPPRRRKTGTASSKNTIPHKGAPSTSTASQKSPKTSQNAAVKKMPNRITTPRELLVLSPCTDRSSSLRVLDSDGPVSPATSTATVPMRCDVDEGAREAASTTTPLAGERKRREDEQAGKSSPTADPDRTLTCSTEQAPTTATAVNTSADNSDNESKSTRRSGTRMRGNVDDDDDDEMPMRRVSGHSSPTFASETPCSSRADSPRPMGDAMHLADAGGLMNMGFEEDESQFGAPSEDNDQPPPLEMQDFGQTAQAGERVNDDAPPMLAVQIGEPKGLLKNDLDQCSNGEDEEPPCLSPNFGKCDELTERERTERALDRPPGAPAGMGNSMEMDTEESMEMSTLSVNERRRSSQLMPNNAHTAMQTPQNYSAGHSQMTPGSAHSQMAGPMSSQMTDPNFMSPQSMQKQGIQPASVQSMHSVHNNSMEMMDPSHQSPYVQTPMSQQQQQQMEQQQQIASAPSQQQQQQTQQNTQQVQNTQAQQDTNGMNQMGCGLPFGSPPVSSMPVQQLQAAVGNLMNQQALVASQQQPTTSRRSSEGTSNRSRNRNNQQQQVATGTAAAQNMHMPGMPMGPGFPYAAPWNGNYPYPGAQLAQEQFYNSYWPNPFPPYGYNSQQAMAWNRSYQANVANPASSAANMPPVSMPGAFNPAGLQQDFSNPYFPYQNFYLPRNQP